MSARARLKRPEARKLEWACRQIEIIYREMEELRRGISTVEQSAAPIASDLANTKPCDLKVVRVKGAGLSEVPVYYYIEPILEQLNYWGLNTDSRLMLTAAHVIKELAEGRGERQG